MSNQEDFERMKKLADNAMEESKIKFDSMSPEEKERVIKNARRLERKTLSAISGRKQ